MSKLNVTTVSSGRVLASTRLADPIFQFGTETVLKTTVVYPDRLFDNASGIELRQRITKIIEAGTETILIDFSNTAFIDSLGLGHLVLALKAARLAGVPIYLCSLNDQCRIIFELTRVNTIFDIFPDAATFRQTVTALIA